MCFFRGSGDRVQGVVRMQQLGVWAVFDWLGPCTDTAKAYPIRHSKLDYTMVHRRVIACVWERMYAVENERAHIKHMK